VPTAPPPGSQFSLDYCEIWARGYVDQEGGFVVMAGAELRTFLNESARSNVGELRRELALAQVLEPIAGIDGRLRLRVAVRFRNAALAAKVVTGAHISRHKWVPLRCGQRS
jgi:hypothetical protein